MSPWAIKGGFDACLKTYVYDAIEAILNGPDKLELSQIVSDPDLLSGLDGHTVRVLKTTVFDPNDTPAIVVQGLPETPLVQFLGQMFSEEGAADADNEWPAHWGARYRAMISIDVVAMNSQLRDDLYRLTKALAMIVAYKIAHNEDSCPFSSPQVSPMGESMAQTVQDPNIFFLAAVRFDAEYALGVTDTAPSVDDIKIGTITPIT